MTENLGFEIREPTQDFPFTVTVRNKGDEDPKNWGEFDGRTRGLLPDLSDWGLELAVQERVEGPEHVVSTILYIPHDLPPEDEDYPGRILGTVLSKEWELFDFDGEADAVEARVMPGIDHAYASWATPLSPEQLAWIRMKEKLARIKLARPELELVGRLPGMKNLLEFAMQKMETKYQIDTCRECTHFDEAEGKREYEKITHKFENGEGQMTKDIAQMVAEERQIRNLKEEEIGLCTTRSTLIEWSFQACPQFEKVP